MSKFVIYQGSGEWSALYVDGKLDRVGDHYLADERLRELVGAETVQSDDFMRGGDYRDDAAPTLDDLNAYAIDRAEKAEHAEQLREQAAELLAQAEKLSAER